MSKTAVSPLSSSLVQEEPGKPPQIKEEPEELWADGPKIIDVRSEAPSSKNFITTDVKTLMFWSAD